MPAKLKNLEIHCDYFRWKLFQRNGVYYADARSGNNTQRRHSLGTRNKAEALRLLKQLDIKAAFQHGLVSWEKVAEMLRNPLPISKGNDIYLGTRQLDQTIGQLSTKTMDRYKQVAAKWARYCDTHGIVYWNHVNQIALKKYHSWLQASGRKPRSCVFEINFICQVMKYLIEEKHLPAELKFRMKLPKVTGSDVHRFSIAEVDAILTLAESLDGYKWMYQALACLAYTGMRISELVNLRWSDVNLTSPTPSILVADCGYRSSYATRTKSRESRVISIHTYLLNVLASMDSCRNSHVFVSPGSEKLNADVFLRLFVKLIIKPLAARFPSTEEGRGFITGRFHSFRHAFCSRAVDSQIPQMVILDWLGHKDSSMTRHYYGISNAESKRLMDSVKVR